MSLTLTLGMGFQMLRAVVAAIDETKRLPQDAQFDLKLTEDFKLECKKFLLYRAHGFRERQWCSLQRMRGLLVMIEETRAHCGWFRSP